MQYIQGTTAQSQPMKIKENTDICNIGIKYIADGCHCLERLVIYSNTDFGVRFSPSTLESLGKGLKN